MATPKKTPPRKSSRAPLDRGTAVPVRPDYQPPKRTRAAVGDSPFLWLLLFAAFGAFGLLAVSTKYGARQTAIEREFYGIRHMQQQVEPGGATETVDAEGVPMLITLRPLFLILGVGAAAGWIMLLWRGGSSPPADQPPTNQESARTPA